MRAAVERCLLRVWFGNGPIERLVVALLSPLAWIVRKASIARREKIRSLPPPQPPVLVVGNLIAGGAGKTPLVIALAQALRQRGLRPGIVCRGYRAHRDDARIVPATGSAAEHGDEALLLARSGDCPVAAGVNRADAMAALLRARPDIDVVIADDGLQHPHLPRTLELAVFDRRGVGNGRLLPAGPLREPIEHLAQMDAVLLNDGVNAPEGAGRCFRFSVVPVGFKRLANPGAGETAEDPAEATAAAAARGQRTEPSARAMPGLPSGAHASPAPSPGLGLTEFVALMTGKSVAAVAGIGHPERFFDTLRGLGIHPVRSIALGDHAPLDVDALRAIEADIVVMTGKDAVKCAQVADSRCWVLEVAADLDPALQTGLLRLCVDHRLLEILVCPVCKGPLRHERANRTAEPSAAEAELICAADRLAFPVADGIPRMLVDEARRLDDAEAGA